MQAAEHVDYDLRAELKKVKVFMFLQLVLQHRMV